MKYLNPSAVRRKQLFFLTLPTYSIARHIPPPLFVSTVHQYSSKLNKSNPSKSNLLSFGSSLSMSTTTAKEDSLAVDPFCFRQFAEDESSKDYKGTIFNVCMEEFTKVANERYDESLLKDGYAPFCKHLFLVNDFTDAQVNVLPITTENESKLRCKYEARNEKELPVLSRYFPKELVTSDTEKLPVGKYLDLILYSREQINKENAAMGNDSNSDAPWGIVSIKCQDVDFELPMQPITAMRNALGADQGGSGIDLDREKYMEAYNYWKDHAVVS